MPQNHFATIDSLERDLWEAADQLRANSKLTSSEYVMPVLGIIFLRHATNRFEGATAQIREDQEHGRMAKRAPIKADYVKRRALFLPEKARFDFIMSLPGSSLGKALVEAMEAIEADFPPLLGVLPKDFGIFEPKVLEDVLRIFNRDALKNAGGDVFGRIYEYFLMKFAMQGAQDAGEFFTPPSLVQTIVNVIEPDHGIVFDPACGSGGMFVQSSHFVEHRGQDASHRLNFYGQEKTATTIKLAKMNLAVHGLEGDIREANTFYDDVHALVGKADFVMSNPPFNVDKVDAETVKGDKRLPFGLPGVNKEKKVSNGNYLWISYFHSYLKDTGRAGFVMSSQASSAGHGERDVRRKIVETGDVDVMIAIRSNFFYTRTVPCELWFFDRGKPKARRNKVLMLDARNVYRKVTRKIYDFSPEQMQNLASIIWLYRGQKGRFVALLDQYRQECRKAGARFRETLLQVPIADLGFLAACLEKFKEYAPEGPSEADKEALAKAVAELKDMELPTQQGQEEIAQVLSELAGILQDGVDAAKEPEEALGRVQTTLPRLEMAAGRVVAFQQTLDNTWKKFTAAIDLAEKKLGARKFEPWGKTWEIPGKRKAIDPLFAALREAAHDQRYFLRQLQWLLHRFPEAELCDVPGLVKLVDVKDIEAADWSLTPGRYVGVAPQEEDDDFDFDQTIRDIHTELADLNKEASELAQKIQETLVGLLE